MKNKESTKKASTENAEWLVSKARNYELSGDVCAAKSWILTAKSLFPRDFSIQYEEFLMERKAGKLQKCGRLFYDMIHIFPKEKTLWEELARIFHSQDATRLQNADSVFLKEMFDSLPPSHQKELLLKYANHHTDLIDKCRISLLVLKRFKGAIKDQAVKLISTLRAAEEKECPDTPLNIYRRMIVCDILPLILKSSETQVVQQITKKKSGILFVTEDQMMEYLNLTTQFYIACAVSKYSFNDKNEQNGTDLKALDVDESISSWHLIHENIVLFANKLNWSNTLKIKDKIDPAKNRPLRSRWKTLNNASKDSKPHLGIFYPLLHLHLLTVVEYCSSVLFTDKKGGAEPTERDFVLLENINYVQKEATIQSVIRTPKRKKKTDDAGGYSSDHQSSSEDVTVVVHPGLLGKVSETLGEHLQVAIDTYNLLNTTFPEEYEAIESEWKMERWEWMKTFHIDSLLFQGKYRKMLERLSEESNQMLPIKHDLRECCSLYCSGQRNAACEKALDIVANLPENGFNGGLHTEDKSVLKSDGRNLIILSNSHYDVLNYSVNILFATLKNNLYCEGPQRNLVIGHLIVLSQLCWSKNQELFLHLLKLIQVQENEFKYELFFAYVTHIDILEEFAYLHSIDSVNMCLLSSDDSQTKRTVTRGVNKEFQDDFNASMMRQVQRSHEPIHKIVFNFLRKEKEAILKAL